MHLIFPHIGTGEEGEGVGVNEIDGLEVGEGDTEAEGLVFRTGGGTRALTTFSTIVGASFVIVCARTEKETELDADESVRMEGGVGHTKLSDLETLECNAENIIPSSVRLL